MARTGIEWTTATWNPTTGCDRVSPGCDNCYAQAMARRLKAMGQPKYQLDGDPRTSGPGFRLTIHEDALEIPGRWRSPTLIFVNSMSDLFHPKVPVTFIRKVLAVAADLPQHGFQILTKRSKRLLTVAPKLDWPSNVWMGVSIESDRYVHRADHLRNAEGPAVKFLSLEPLLGPLPSLTLDGIDWVIAGGESGAGYRPVELGWIRDLRDACQTAQVPFFFKQWGGRSAKQGGRELDGRTWSELPSGTPPALLQALLA
jgi:protein gp37